MLSKTNQSLITPSLDIYSDVILCTNTIFMKLKSTNYLLLLTLCMNMLACSEDEKASTKKYTFTADTDWNCGGNFCQDVWEVKLVKGTKASFSISDLTGGSMGQIALYAPGVDLGGINLFTGNTNELSCTNTGNCDNGVTGVTTEISITKSGTYHFVATRNNNESCGSSGTYTVTILSTDETPAQIANDTQSLAPETPECNL